MDTAVEKNVHVHAELDEPANKRLAHTASEQKRRLQINIGFAELKQIIPDCKSTDSKALVLNKGML